MAERHVVARTGELEDRSGIVVTVDGQSVGVFNVGGRYFALSNRCPHQGGPVCEGTLFPHHTAKIAPTGRVDEYLDHENPVICCPWHGWEFDLASGTCLADPSRRVQSYRVEVDGEDIVLLGRNAPVSTRRLDQVDGGGAEVTARSERS
jgi:nitrite reductase (NADH) small subunit